MIRIPALIVTFFLLSGCTLLGRLNPNASPRIPEETMYLHTVSSSEESLPMIAEWYSGDMKNWKILKASNCSSTIFRIKPGSIIRIPAPITQQRALMTREFITAKKNSYRIAPRENQQKNSSPAKESAQPQETPPSEELSAKDELIDNLIGESSLTPSEIAEPLAGE